MKISFSKRLGELLAHIQDLFDALLRFGFKRASESGKHIRSKDGTPKKILKFFGELGESFFNKYDDIKTEKKESENDKGK